MEVIYESLNTAPDVAQMNSLLSEYYSLIVSRLGELGAQGLDRAEEAQEEFWEEFDQFMPPTGRLILAKTKDGELLGCGSLKSVGNRKAELKRLFVRPAARGLGIGRKLVEQRIEAAREMGLKMLLVDTVANNVEMRALYDKLGFKEIDVYPESSSFKLAPELVKYFRFYSMDL